MVNGLGQLKDNGDDNFDYVIVIPYYFETESADTIFEKRVPMGNRASDNDFIRDDNDKDGMPYDADDLDFENFTVKLMDASGWPSTPKWHQNPVNKGSETNPTTVIITGAFLSLGNSEARENLTEAEVNSIISVL